MRDILDKVKEIVADVSGLDPRSIGSQDSLVDDLQLDSLSLLEIGVDVDYAFRLDLPGDRWQGIRTIADAVALVCEGLAARTPRAEAA